MGRKPLNASNYGYSTRAKIALSGMAVFPLLLILLVLWRGLGEEVSEEYLLGRLSLLHESIPSSSDVDAVQNRLDELTEELNSLIKDVLVQQTTIETKCKEFLTSNGIVYNSLPDNPFNSVICEQMPSELIISETNLLTCEEILHVLIPKTEVAQYNHIYESVTGVYNDEQIILHWVSPKVTSVRWCLKHDHNGDVRGQCYKQANLKLVQEITLLKRLKIQNMVQLRGYCTIEGEGQLTFSEPKSVIVAVESGKKFDVQEAKKTSFENRIKMCASLCQLLVQLSASSFGSIRLTNISQDQFIIDATGNLKLLDVLSLQYEEPHCNSSEDCVSDGVQLSSCNPLGHCIGYNTKRNTQKFTEKFFAPLLTGDIPSKHEPKVAAVLSLLRENQKELAVIQGTFHGIQTDLGAVTTSAPTSNAGNDKGVKVVEYEMIPNADFHGRYDYKCPRTRASWGCVLSVYGLNNAKKQCTYDDQCKAFTVIAHYARPGWFTTFFKDAVDPDDNFDSRPGANLFIKYVKYESVPGATVTTVTPSQKAADTTDTNKQMDTETVPFNKIIARDNGEVDSKQVDVDTKEEKLKEHYEGDETGGGGGAVAEEEDSKTGGGAVVEEEDSKTGGVAGDDGGAADGEIIAVTESATTTSDCFSEILVKYGNVLRNREARLMEVCDWQGMSVEKWMSILKASNVSADSTSDPPPGDGTSYPIRVKLHSTEGLTYRAVMKTGSTSTYGHVSQLLYYMLDRKLGLYNSVPTVGRILSSNDFTNSHLDDVNNDYLTAYTTQVKSSGQAGVTLSAVPENSGLDKSHFLSTVKPLTETAWAVTQLSKEQESYLENIYLGWLAGLDPLTDNAVIVKGFTVNVNSEGAFRTWNSALLNYANSCHFPQHMVEILKYSVEYKCPLSVQLAQQLLSSPLHVNAALTLSHTDEHGDVVHPLLNIDHAASQLLERIDKCVDRFGEAIVLYS